MRDIVIAGSGPVGSFTATLCALLGFRVTVYEKREAFTRKINVKMEINFFKEVQEIVSRLHIQSDFFKALNEDISNHNNTILIKDLEDRLTREAKLLGVKYITKEVESFQELYEKHETSDPIILDCTGRNSKLRTSEFGTDADNLVTTPLQHAMYINFKAKLIDKVSSLYQVMKYVTDIKLTNVIVGKNKDENGFTNVTIPVFIDEALARVFDAEHPDISRNPLNPFNASKPVSDRIFFPVSSIIGNLIVDRCIVDLNSVTVKKIEIGCGYAKKRSKVNFVCLGDSAIHLAFFRSLNLGLKHALDFFIKLSMFCAEVNVQEVKESDVIKSFKEHISYRRSISAIPTKARNVFLMVTQVIWYGCYSYCLTDFQIRGLTSPFGVYQSDIINKLDELNTYLNTWGNALVEFETSRDADIKKEINSNKTKSMRYDYLSWFIDINGKSFIKISELARAARCKYPLYIQDFQFLLTCFKARRESTVSTTAIDCKVVDIVSNLLNQGRDLRFPRLREVCANDDLTVKEKLNSINDLLELPEVLERGCSMSTFKRDSGDPDTSYNFIALLIKNELACIRNEKSMSTSESCDLSLNRARFVPVSGPSLGTP